MTKTDADKTTAAREAETRRLLALWDEGLASGPAGELDIEALIRRARAISPWR